MNAVTSQAIRRAKAIISSKGQIVIPRKFRELLGMHSGIEVVLAVRSDGVLEVNPVKRSIDMFFGRCKQTASEFRPLDDPDSIIANVVLSDDDQSRGLKDDRG